MPGFPAAWFHPVPTPHIPHRRRTGCAQRPCLENPNMVTHGLRLARVDTVQNRPESWVSRCSAPSAGAEIRTWHIIYQETSSYCRSNTEDLHGYNSPSVSRMIQSPGLANIVPSKVLISHS